MTEPDPSVRALIAQWREQVKASQQRARRLSEDGYDTWSNGYSSQAATLRQCADELEAALKPLADLEAEMRRFAETQTMRGEIKGEPHTWYFEGAEEALAWAERIRRLYG